MALLVADTGPLIAFGLLGRIDLLARLYGPVLIPPAVEEELHLHGDRPDTPELRKAFQTGLIAVQTPSEDHDDPAGGYTLDDGERQAIALALEIEAALLLMDERKGRMAAQALGLPIVGTVGALLKAKRNGLIPELAPLLAALSVHGYRLAPALVAHALALAGEI